MKKLLLAVVASLAVLSVVPTAAGASGHTTTSTEDLQWARRLNFYYFGSGENPLVNGSCGRMVHGAFILTAAIEPDQERDCSVPHGVPILGTPAGSITWSPTDGSTPADLAAERDALLAELHDRRASVDGAALPMELVKGNVHPIKLQPGNLIQSVDPAVKGTSTPVATGTWMVWMRGLSVGEHEVVLSDVIDGTTADITFHLSVR